MSAFNWSDVGDGVYKLNLMRKQDQRTYMATFNSLTGHWLRLGHESKVNIGFLDRIQPHDSELEWSIVKLKPQTTDRDE